MVRWYPGDLIRALEGRYPPEKVHSIVLVTKFPEAILTQPARPVLARYDQVVAQVTITGLGGTGLEPHVPDPDHALASLARLVDFVGRPERVIVRIDPIVHWRQSAAGGVAAPLESNLPAFAEIARRARQAGIGLVKTSLVSPYPKVVRRFARAGLELIDLTGHARERAAAELECLAIEAGVTLEFCCERTRSTRACIDAELLTRLHPKGLPARPDRPAGQRGLCGCSHSIDLAWYSAHPCPSSCLYCYANPTPRGPALPEAVRGPGPADPAR